MSSSRTSANQTDLTAASTGTVTLIRPPRLLEPLALGELWEFRFLIWMWGARALRGRYKQSILGFAWAAAGPLVNALVYALVFGKLAGISAGDGKPYVLYAFIANLPWTFMRSVFDSTANSLQANKPLVQKVYFPRLVLPLAALIGIFTTTGIQFVIQLGLMGSYNVWPELRMLVLIPVCLYVLLVGLGVGMVVCALSLRYRDVSFFASSVVVQFWMYATPIAYPARLVQEKLPDYYWLYQLNPMFLPTELARWAVFGNMNDPGPWFWAPPLVMLALLIVGLVLFRRAEQTVADII